MLMTRSLLMSAVFVLGVGGSLAIAAVEDSPSSKEEKGLDMSEGKDTADRKPQLGRVLLIARK